MNTMNIMFWEKRMSYKAVIFDLDGTLINTIEDLKTATNYALSKNCFKEITTDQTLACVGNGVMNLIKQAALYDNKKADEKILVKMFEDFNVAYKKCFMDQTRAYDGIYEILKIFNANGIKLAVNTNKLQNFAESLIKKVLKDIDFVTVIGDNLKHPKKPDPYAVDIIAKTLCLDKKDILYVGDSEVDLSTGVNAGVDTCFVDWGFRKYDDIKHIKHQYRVFKSEEILNIVLKQKVIIHK